MPSRRVRGPDAASILRAAACGAGPVIGQDTIERVRQDCGIVAVIGESVKLVRKGRSYVGLCPFHKEKTPSFNVNEERGFYHCFGCKASGDVIRFTQETQGVGFAEAVRMLAERAGIAIVETASEPERRQQAEARRRQQELYDAGNVAASLFERLLVEHPLASYARAELERRGLSTQSPTDVVADTLQAFRVGYAPYSWDALVRHLRESGISLQAAESVGLIAPRKSGSGHYDRFRHRLMFAVIDLQGRVIAFSGRALEEPSDAELAAAGAERMGSGDPPAKYMNSPESPIYRKREAVFGLYQARQALRTEEECVVVEGNFDVMSLHARGIANVVAPLGTAFTPEQARQIKRFAPRVALLFDGDTAGRKAAQAAYDPCHEAGLFARVATLPDGTDPDDLIRTHGPEAVTAVVKAGRGILEYLIAVELDPEFSSADAQERAARLRRVTELLSREQDPTVRAMTKAYADSIAARLGVADATTFEALERSVRRALTPRADTGPAPVAAPNRARSRDRRDDIGLIILGAFLDYPELLDTPEAVEGAGLLEGDAAGGLAALRQSWNGVALANPEQVLAKLSPSIHPFAAARLAAPVHGDLEDARTELVSNIHKLKRLELRRRNSEVVEEIQRAAATGDFEEQAALLREQFLRAQERHGLGQKR